MKSLPSKFILLMLSLNSWAATSDVHLRVAVHSEDGTPVSGVRVQGYFTNLRYDYRPEPGRLSLTNDEGIAEISGPALVSVNVEASKEGYYKSKQQVVVNQLRDQSIFILLREKRNPIAMYAKKVVLELPGREQKYGFDFLKGDLVGDGSNGKQSDLIMEVKRNLVDENNLSQTLTIAFSNPADGIAPMLLDKEWKVSEFKVNYMAPAEGYSNAFEVVDARSSTGYTNINRNTPFYARIRTKADQEGKIESAYYCKIWPGIDVYGVLIDKPLIEMTYYCNSTINNRNMEFDVNRNLFKNLDVERSVSAP